MTAQQVADNVYSLLKLRTLTPVGSYCQLRHFVNFIGLTTRSLAVNPTPQGDATPQAQSNWK